MYRQYNKLKYNGAVTYTMVACVLQLLHTDQCLSYTPKRAGQLVQQFAANFPVHILPCYQWYNARTK